MRLILCIIFFFSLVLSAQDRTVDSLKLALKNAKHDTIRLEYLSQILEKCDFEDVFEYSKQLEKNALKNITPCKNIKLKLFYLKHLANAYDNLGFMYNFQGDIPNALEYFHKSLKIQEENKNQFSIALCLNNIGSIYLSQNENSKSIEYFNKALKIYSESNRETGIALSLHNLGSAYALTGKKEVALSHFIKALELYKKLNDTVGITNCLSNMGVLYRNLHDIDNANKYFNKSLKMQTEINDKQGMAHSLSGIASVLILSNKLSEALSYAIASYNIVVNLGSPNDLKNTAKTLKTIYQKQNKYKEAFEMYELEIQMTDSINNTETKKVSIKKQFQYEYEKKAAADSVKNAEEQKVKNALLTAQQAQLKQEKTQRLALYGGLVLVIAFSGFVFNRFRVTQKQKVIIEQQKVLVDDAFAHLEEKNKEVMDSIHYAKRIQTALLTSEKYIDRKLNELN